MASDRVIVIVEPRTDLVRVVFPVFGSGGAVTVGGVAVVAGDVPAGPLAAALVPFLLPIYPATAGAYALTVTVTAGVGVLSWAAGGVSPPPPPPGSPSFNFSVAANSQYLAAVL